MAESNDILAEITGSEYQYGWSTDIESENAHKGLTEDTVRFISKKKNEPQWVLDFRLKAFRHWLTLQEPRYWPHLKYPTVNFQDIIYYSAPKPKAQL